MEFDYRDPKNLIQAQVACRLGSISRDYSQLDLPENQFFPDTLNLCILQNVVNTCDELYKGMSNDRYQRPFFEAPLDPARHWGLRKDMVEDTFKHAPLTLKDFLRHLRNSLSHPRNPDPYAEFPATGYTTLPDGSGDLKTFYFVDSRDVHSNGNPMTYEQKKAERLLSEGQSEHSHQPRIPQSIEIRQVRKFDGKRVYGFFWPDGNPFTRIFTIELTVHNLAMLAQGLCNHLAQPTREKWDHINIAHLIT